MSTRTLESRATIAADEPMRDARSARARYVALLAAEFERLYALVYRFLLHRVFDAELAEELTARTFYKAATSGARVGDDAGRLQAWVLRIAANAANTHVRRRRLRRVLLGRFARSGLGSAPNEPDSPDEQRSARVRSALLALPPKHQTSVVLRYFLELSYGEIAAVLGCRVEAARARVSRALKEMRARLELPGAHESLE